VGVNSGHLVHHSDGRVTMAGGATMRKYFAVPRCLCFLCSDRDLLLYFQAMDLLQDSAEGQRSTDDGLAPRPVGRLGQSRAGGGPPKLCHLRESHDSHRPGPESLRGWLAYRAAGEAHPGGIRRSDAPIRGYWRLARWA